MLASYTWGDESLWWTSLSEQDRVLFALKNIAELHGRPLEDHGYGKDEGEKTVRSHFVAGMSHSWAEDEFSHGAFAVFDPHHCTELFTHVWRPCGPVHFAGEHTSLKHGWIEGAVESGIRAAVEVVRDLALSSGLDLQNALRSGAMKTNTRLPR